MAQFCGKWELVGSDDNFFKYMESVGVSEEKRQLAKTALTAGSKLVQSISRDGTKWTVGVVTKEGEKADVYTEGTPTEVFTLDGRKVTAVYSLEGDSLVENQKGDGFESRNVRTVNGDILTMTLTANDGVSCTRTYKKVS
ncbi:sodium/calcium exchanger regulatory protein 1-like [Physella acuta]|uniref:sodium/calcium exchanger regulatory protein 1-like n=1 Tax=Physella acuta TaxID=109671 RepID=UPI0027DD8310|nr:sodium/calcium exchanger regulatory protein 1-like [Physella acuta]